MRADIERWEQKYQRRGLHLEITPDPLLLCHRGLFTGHGRSLDVASGLGDNAMFLAGLGFETYAVDGSFNALSMAQARARAHNLNIHTWVADLDTYPLPECAFEVILVMRFLNRSLIEQFKNALRPGGLFVYKTFNANFLTNKPDFPPAYVLQPGELATFFRNWRCIETNDRPDNPETESYWIGQKS
ncbi:MAG: class I SAM-dependent methyltransferase [Gammaproteobacteria bacterium]|nr:class I SAM-dependent methyltransferase [Gammaproteobacteria bacterium]